MTRRPAEECDDHPERKDEKLAGGVRGRPAALGFRADGAGRGRPGPREPGPAAAGGTAFGAYLHYGPAGIRRMEELREWLGGTELRVGHTYLPGDRWSNISGQVGFLEEWARWRRARADRMFVLNVPMLELNETRLPDPVVRRMLRAGAEGRYDRHFRRSRSGWWGWACRTRSSSSAGR